MAYVFVHLGMCKDCNPRCYICVMIHEWDKCVRKIYKELKETKFLSNAILIMIDGIKQSSKLRKKILTLVGWKSIERLLRRYKRWLTTRKPIAKVIRASRNETWS